jgi:transitional endoplasmic reticulum ATPase
MVGRDDTIRSLREALELSPDNVPLRRHLAETLLDAGLAAEAVSEYRQALSAAPHDRALQLGLAEAFRQAGNLSAALVIVEELLKANNVSGETHLLYCRLLLDEEQFDRAARAYRDAVEAEPALADKDLASRLGVDAATGRARIDSDSDVDEQGRVRLGASDDRPRDFQFDLERPRVDFGDVGGMGDLKEEIRMKILHPLAHPELYRAYGKPIGGGILMYGPPGCGKTFLARATAGQVNAAFLAVGINDVLDMYLGNSERNLHELFSTARRNTPCVLFFDEVDALGASRSDMKHSAGKHLINQFLSELDGVKNSNDGVLVLGATNAPWHLDSAFRRPGRFDRVLFVPPPDRTARADILKVLLQGKPLGDVDYDAIAAKTDAFSGADLKGIIDLAIEAKLREAMKRAQPLPLTTKDLAAAAKQQKPTTKDWFATARNYALYSNQGGLYDDVLAWLKIK